jgi:hypothetical protein
MARARTYFPADQAFRIGFDMWALSLEASAVMGLRTLKIAAGGPDAQAEAGRMIGEKVEALAALQTKALTGAMGLTAASATRATLKHYRRKVRANRRRLTQA